MNKDSSEPTEAEEEYERAQNLIADLSALKVYEPTFEAHMKMLMKQGRPHTKR